MSANVHLSEILFVTKFLNTFCDSEAPSKDSLDSKRFLAH